MGFKQFIMTLRYFVLTAVLFFITAAHAQTGTVTKNNTDTTQWLSQTDTTYQFSFKYPSGWTLKLPNTNTRFFVTSQQESDTDNFRENINCLVKKIDQKNLDIKTAEAAVLKNLSEGVANFKLISLRYGKWNNLTAMQLDYTATSESGGIVYKIHMYQQIAVFNDLVFTLSYTAETDSYSKYLPTIKKIIQSIKLL